MSCEVSEGFGIDTRRIEPIGEVVSAGMRGDVFRQVSGIAPILEYFASEYLRMCIGVLIPFGYDDVSAFALLHSIAFQHDK